MWTLWGKSVYFCGNLFYQFEPSYYLRTQKQKCAMLKNKYSHWINEQWVNGHYSVEYSLCTDFCIYSNAANIILKFLIRQFLKMLKLTIFSPLKELKFCIHKSLYTNAHNKIIHNRQKVESTQVPTDWLMDKQSVIQSHDGILSFIKRNGVLMINGTTWLNLEPWNFSSTKKLIISKRLVLM